MKIPETATNTANNNPLTSLTLAQPHNMLIAPDDLAPAVVSTDAMSPIDTEYAYRKQASQVVGTDYLGGRYIGEQAAKDEGSVWHDDVWALPRGVIAAGISGANAIRAEVAKNIEDALSIVPTAISVGKDIAANATPTKIIDNISVGSVVSPLYDIINTIGNIITSPSLAGANVDRARDNFYSMQKSQNEIIKRQNARVQSWLDSAGLSRTERDGILYDLGSGATSVLASIGIGLATKNPYVATYILGAQQGSSMRQQALDSGSSIDDANQLAAMDTGWQGATELIGGEALIRLLGRTGAGKTVVNHLWDTFSQAIGKIKNQPALLKKLATKPMVAAIGMGALSEGVEEFAQQLGEDELALAYNVNDLSAKEVLYDAFYNGAIGAVLGGAFGGAVNATKSRAFFDRQTKKTSKSLQDIGMPKRVADKLAAKAVTGAMTMEGQQAILSSIDDDLQMSSVAADYDPQKIKEALTAYDALRAQGDGNAIRAERDNVIKSAVDQINAQTNNALAPEELSMYSLLSRNYIDNYYELTGTLPSVADIVPTIEHTSYADFVNNNNSKDISPKEKLTQAGILYQGSTEDPIRKTRNDALIAGTGLETVKNETGWTVKGSAWVYTLSQKNGQLNAKTIKDNINPETKSWTGTLSSVLYHNNLYTAFPILKNTNLNVNIINNGTSNVVWHDGFSLPDGQTVAPTLEVNAKSLNNLKATIYKGIADHLSTIKDPTGKMAVAEIDGKEIPAEGLGQKEVIPRGAITFDKGRAIIHLFEGSDKSTIIHEMAHMWLNNWFGLYGIINNFTSKPTAIRQQQALDDWLGKPDKQSGYSKKQQEKFAKGFESYLLNGVSPSYWTGSIFGKIKDWMVDIYHALKGSIAIDDNVKSFFDSIIAGDSVTTDANIAKVTEALPLLRRAVEDVKHRGVAYLSHDEANTLNDLRDVLMSRPASMPTINLAAEIAHNKRIVPLISDTALANKLTAAGYVIDRNATVPLRDWLVSRDYLSDNATDADVSAVMDKLIANKKVYKITDNYRVVNNNNYQALAAKIDEIIGKDSISAIYNKFSSNENALFAGERLLNNLYNMKLERIANAAKEDIDAIKSELTSVIKEINATDNNLHLDKSAIEKAKTKNDLSAIIDYYIAEYGPKIDESFNKATDWIDRPATDYNAIKLQALEMLIKSDGDLKTRLSKTIKFITGSLKNISVTGRNKILRKYIKQIALADGSIADSSSLIRKILTEAQKVETKEYSLNIKGYIDNLARTRYSLKGRTIKTGKYSYEVNSILQAVQELKSISKDKEALVENLAGMQAKIADNKQEMSLKDKITASYANYLLRDGDISREGLQELYHNLKDLLVVGKDQKAEEKILLKKEYSDENKDLEAQVWNNVNILTGISDKNFNGVSKVKRFLLKSYIWTFSNWESFINSITNRRWSVIVNAPSGKMLKNEYSLLKEETDANIWSVNKKDAAMASIAQIYGLKNNDEMFDKIEQLADKTISVENKNTGSYEILSVADIIYLYTLSKNEIQRERLINQYNLEGTKDSFGLDLDAAFGELTSEDKQVSDLLISLMDDYYNEVNPVYVKERGLDLGKPENYFPVKTKTIKDVTEDYLAENYQAKSTNPSFTKARENGKKVEIVPSNAFNVLFGYIDKAGKYIKLAEKLNKLRKIYVNDNIRVALNELSNDNSIYNTGVKLLDNVSENINPMYDYTNPNLKLMERIVNNYIKSKIAGKPTVLIKQLASCINYSENMPVGTWLTGFIDAVMHPVATIKFMKELSPYIDARYQLGGVNYELQKALSDDNQIKSPLETKINRFTTAFTKTMRLGDIGAVIFGGKPYVDYLMKEKGMSPEAAEKEFRLSTLRAQQSGNTSALSVWQYKPKSPFMQILWAFRNSQIQYMRKWVDSVIDYKRGEISKMQLAKTFFIYGFMNAWMYEILTSLGILRVFRDKDKNAKKEEAYKFVTAPVDQLSGVLPIMDTMVQLAEDVTYNLALRSKGERKKTYKTNTVTPIADETIDLLKLIDKKDISFADWQEAITPLAEDLTGLPLNYGANIVSSVGDAATGNYMVAILKDLGYTNYRAQLVSGALTAENERKKRNKGSKNRKF